MPGAVTEETKRKMPHHLTLEDRSRMTVTAVQDVAMFEETQIVLITQMGELTIKGEGLRISELSVESGEIHVQGKVDYLVYTDDQVNEGGFFARLFR